MLPKELKCAVCDACFAPHTRCPHQITCSKSCRQNYRHRLKRGLPTKNLKLNCKVCGIEFKQKKSNNREYCNWKCKKLACSRRNQGLPIFGPKKHIHGSGYTTHQGYRIISKKHPNSSKRGQILEHIYIMSQHLGRPLHKYESVHHKNGIRDDNRIENLELWCKTEKNQNQRWGQRLEDKIAWCKEFLEQYGHKVIMGLNI